MIYAKHGQILYQTQLYTPLLLYKLYLKYLKENYMIKCMQEYLRFVIIKHLFFMEIGRGGGSGIGDYFRSV